MREKLISKIPLKRFAKVEEIAPLFVFLASSGSDFINGAVIPVDDGAQYNPE
ncbi:MAG: SDR family oxidoreductase [Chlamydiia bacterium]|nr:SDR family oxidoreductase [Chlamydiia bacterium]